MQETPERREERLLREAEAKNVEHYSVLLAAWLETRMERDRTLVTLSAGGIGLLVTILATVGVHYWWEVLAYAGAIGSFLVTIGSSLVIFQGNSDLIRSEITESAEEPPDLKKYDRRSIAGFVAGIALALVAGGVSALATLHTKESEAMANKRETTEQTRPIHTTEGRPGERQSVQDINVLRPVQPQTKPAESAAAPVVQPAAEATKAAEPTSGTDKK